MAKVIYSFIWIIAVITGILGIGQGILFPKIERIEAVAGIFSFCMMTILWGITSIKENHASY